MGCCHGYALVPGGESAFSIDPTSLVFGRGALGELGHHAASVGARRVALFTDVRVRATPSFAAAAESLRAAGVDTVVYDEVRVEPTDASFREAAAFAREGRFDGYVSLGGGSVIDTCKAAALYATFPAELATYVNAPLGEGRPVPGALPPHIACPTTSGTGSECTGIAVFDWQSQRKKTGIASRRLRPTLALVDPEATHTLPRNVVMASGFDVLSHAIESYTARPYVSRPATTPALRPMSQGRNPWSDLGSLEALRLGGAFLVRAVTDASDEMARHELAWAATLAGIAFGNAGVHLPHAMSYSVAGLVHAFHLEGYPDEPLVPHGVSVIENAPAVFRATAGSSPERHLEAAEALGADVRGASPEDAGEVLATRLEELLRATGAPLGLSALGYEERHLDELAAGAFAQKRLVDNAPIPVDVEKMRDLFRESLHVRR